MNILLPKEITTDSFGPATSIPELDTAQGEVAWVGSGNYKVGDRRVYERKIYECVKDHTGTAVTPDKMPAEWLFKEPTNRWCPFDQYLFTKARAPQSLTYELKGVFIDGLALYGLEGDSLTISITAGPGGPDLLPPINADLWRQAYGEWEYLFGDLQRGDHYVLNGSKTWITNGPDANTYVIYAKTDLEKGPHGITAFIVERDWKGFSRGSKFDKLGMRGSNTCELFFDDVEVPEENVLGQLNGGVRVLMSGLDYERVVLSGGPTGIMQACMDVIVPYIHDRKQFGQSIGEFQLIQGKVADMYTVLQAARSFAYTVAKNLDLLGTDHVRQVRKDCASVILWTAEKATWMAGEGVQIYGGNGYINEYPLGRLWRDAKLYEIGAGTSEIRRMLIGRELFAETC